MVAATIRDLKVSSVLQNHRLLFSSRRAEWREAEPTVETVDAANVEGKLGEKDCVIVDAPASSLYLLLLL